MRGFLIRDILSAPTANAPAESSAGEQQASSSFDCASAQTLAQTQARFLAKLAEHQQHVQASKYYEQLQHQHQQLLNLNLNHHHLQLQQQLAQQQQQQQLHPAPGKQLSGALSAATGCSEGATASSKKQKTSSFAYDCASPISSISDVDRQEEEDDEDEDDDDEDRERDDEQDLDDEEIEVEKLVGEEPQGKGASARLSIRRQHRNREQDRRNHDTDDQDDHHRDLNPDGSSRMTMQQQQQQQQLLGKQLAAPFQLNSPLDALFQMTSSTFDALKRGEKRKDRDADHHGSTNFTSKQTSKKKRKSRTAFTNNQIYELERRFRMQKYLSPTDRDEIAMTLSLSNAQVITWFQNRRAKLKRDQEEQKRDIETASLLNLHKTFLESFQALSQMKTAIKTTDNSICRTGGTNIHEERDMNQLS